MGDQKLTKQYDIVISIASDANEPLCLQIREELVERGYRVFMDLFNQYSDEKMAPIIENCCFFIACLTQNYMDEKSREKSMALNLEKAKKLTIQVAFLDDVDKKQTDITWLIGRGIYIDFVAMSFEDAITKLENQKSQK